MKAWNIPGLGVISLPETITVETILTPVGVHRPGRIIRRDGSTVHETGNRGNGSGARMHSNWQDSCTPGHPNGYVGVTAYVENRLIIVKIPLNESSIHSGDWRNNSQPSMEICVNADRNAEQTEDTAMWWQAAILATDNFTAKDRMYPHRSGSGCPAIINAQGRWAAWERGVDERIRILRDGGDVPTPPSYVDAVPVPKTWDGLDWERPNDGHLFIALQRVFVAKVKTAARVSASPDAKIVRRDLESGEAFLAHYITRGSDGGWWFVSQYGSRIAAADCDPDVTALFAQTTRRSASAARSVVLVEPDAGLDASEVPDDAEPIDKATFMEGA
jgi:hypothetical protein